MKGKHAKNTANKQKLAKRMLALCFAVVFLCSCVLPVFATGSSLLTDALRDGSIDAAMPINRDYWLAEQAGFIQSSMMSTTSLVAIYAGGNLDDALKSIAYHDRSLLDSIDLKVRYPEATITQYPSAEACIDAIKAGKATCMIMTITGLDTLRDQVDLGNLVTSEMPKSIALACWLRQGDAQLLSIVNKGIVNAADDIAASAYSHYSYSDD